MLIIFYALVTGELALGGKNGMWEELATPWASGLLTQTTPTSGCTLIPAMSLCPSGSLQQGVGGISH